MLIATTEISGRNFVIDKGDVFELIGSFIAEGGYEYKVIRRLADGHRFNVRVEKLDLFDAIPSPLSD